MADQTYDIKSQGQGQDITLLKKYKALEVTSISDADTITVAGLTTINEATVIDLADATEFTVTESQIELVKNMGFENDFYLTHQMKEKNYSKTWMIYYPKGF